MTGRSVSMRSADTVTPKAIRMVWRDRFIRGALNLVSGQPGAGKSTLTAMICGDLSRSGLTGILSNVEDDPETVTVPRLIAHDAVLERVHVIPPEDAPLFPAEFELLEEVIIKAGVSYTIIDPVEAHFQPTHMAHRRSTLRRLTAIARRTNTAIIALHHTTKTGEVGGANSGLRGTSRASYVYGYDPSDEDRRALSVDKVNGISEPPTLLFEHEVVELDIGGHVAEAGRLRKVRQSTAQARTTKGRRDPERDAACHAWLSEFLASGEDCARASNEVYEKGREEGYGQATLKRAKVELQVEHVRVGGWGGEGHWTWRLPDDHPLRNPREGDGA